MPTDCVLLTVDCLRRDHVGCYGYQRATTPNIDDFAEKAAVYDGYSNCPGTRWAFQSIHTGVSTPRIDGLGVPDDYKPLAKHFQENGYVTAGFANNGFVSREYGYDTGFDTFYSIQEARQSDTLIERLGKRVNTALDNDFLQDQVLTPIYNRWFSPESSGGKFMPEHSDEDTVEAALSWYSQHDGQPRFLWIHLMDAHTPYGFWEDELKVIRGNADIDHTIHPRSEGYLTVGEEPPQRLVDTYDACVRRVDSQIGRVLDAVSDDSTIIITGDHGEEFGRNNLFHTASLHQSMTNVPFLVRSPLLDGGRQKVPAQHLDIPPTLLASADISIPSDWEGDALFNVSRESDYPIRFSLGNDHLGVQKDGKKLIREEQSERAYQLTKDGEQRVELDSNSFDEMELFLTNYERIISRSIGSGAAELGEGDLSKAAQENLKDLGYI